MIDSLGGKKAMTHFKLSPDQKKKLKELKGIKGKKGKADLKNYLTTLESDLKQGELKGASKLSETEYGSKKFLGSIRGRSKRKHTTYNLDGQRNKVITKGDNGLVSTLQHKYNKTGKLTGTKEKIRDRSTFAGKRFGKGSRTVKTQYQNGVATSVRRSRGLGRSPEKTQFIYQRDSQGNIIHDTNQKPILLKTKKQKGYLLKSRETYTKANRETALKELEPYTNSNGTINWDRVERSDIPNYRKKELKQLYALGDPEKYGQHQLQESKIFRKKKQQLAKLGEKKIETRKNILKSRETQHQLEAKDKHKTMTQAQNKIKKLEEKKANTLSQLEKDELSKAISEKETMLKMINKDKTQLEALRNQKQALLDGSQIPLEEKKRLTEDLAHINGKLQHYDAVNNTVNKIVNKGISSSV